MRKALRLLFAALSLWINENTGGEKGQFLCARIADRYGAYSWPCRFLDWMAGEESHCRKQLFAWRYRK